MKTEEEEKGRGRIGGEGDNERGGGEEHGERRGGRVGETMEDGSGRGGESRSREEVRQGEEGMEKRWKETFPFLNMLVSCELGTV